MRFSARLIAPCLLIAVSVFVAVVFGDDNPRRHGEFTKGTSVRIAYFPNLTHAVALVGVKQGLWQKALGDHRLEVKVVNAGPEAMEALLAGAIDFAYVGPSPAINTYIKSDGKALKILAGACDGGASLVARKGSAVAQIRDLEGKSLAVPQFGGTQDVSARFFLAKEGLKSNELGGSVRIIPVKNADMLGLMKTGQIDAAWVPEPWASRCVVELGAQRVVDERDLWPDGFPTTVLVVRTAFADQHPDLLQAALSAHNQALEMIRVEPGRAKKTVNEELTRLTGKPISDRVMDMSWSRLDFTGSVKLDNLNKQADAAVRAGYLPANHTSLEGIVR